MRTGILFFLFCIFSITEMHTQTVIEQDTIQKIEYDKRKEVTPLNFEEDVLEAYKTQDEFDYSEKKIEESWWAKFKRWLSNIFNEIWHYLFGNVQATGIIGFLLKSIPYVVIGGIIALIVWLFIKLNPAKGLQNKNKNQEVFLSEEQEIIENKNIEALIKEAIAQGDLRLAVRFYYLLILRELKNKQLINYEQEKTNEDYIKEIKYSQINEPFKQLTSLYDFVWYGNFSINPQQYKTAETNFLTLKDKINTGSYE